MHLWHTSHNRGNATKALNKMQKNIEENKFICDSGLNLH